MAATRSWVGRLRSAWESVRGSYWFVPSLMAAAAAAAGFLMLELDRKAVAPGIRELLWIRETGSEGTRAVLATIAGSMITVTGVVFSVTVVALTLASSQFGPRLLRTFLRDRHNQFVLGTFVATFLYTLVVLRAVQEDSVPQLATAGAALLAVASVFVLVYFIHHASSSIQASSVIAAVAREARRQVDARFPHDVEARRGEAPEDAARLAALAHDGRDVEAEACGWVRVVDASMLVRLAAECDVLIDLRRRPGDFLCGGIVIARVGPAGHATDEVCRSIENAFVVGDERTAVQDLAFLAEQLVEIAVRALSPGVNDPGTAVACVNRLADLVARLAERDAPPERLVDGDGTLRVWAHPAGFAELVATCFDPIRRHGAQEATVALALLDALGFAAQRARDAGRRQLLLEHAGEVHDAFEAGGRHAARDVAAVGAALARVRAGSGGRA